jgi:putative DNA primase/helicase
VAASLGPTEDGVAVLFAQRNKDNLRWDPDQGKWMAWEGCRWVPDREGGALEMARDILRYVADATGKDKWLSHRVVRAVETLARTDPLLVAGRDAWDRDPWLLGTPGGVVDLRTGELRPARRGDGMTKLAAVAPADGGEPTGWLRFLREAAGGDDELVAFIQRMCGYALSGDTSEQCLFFLYGPGRNGKNVFYLTLSGILRDYWRMSAMGTLTAGADARHSTDLAMLRGARLVTASETDEGGAWAEARIKGLTGGDPITARFTHKDNFTFKPEFKLVIIGNHKPTLSSVDEALRRRFHFLPFVRTPAEPISKLEDVLVAEWPRILRWMIDGCMEWQAAGLRPPAAVLAETGTYFEDQDLLGQWVKESCDVDVDQWEIGQKLYESYCRFLEYAGEKKIGRKTFTQVMRKRGFPPDHKMFPNRVTARIIRGLYLQSEGRKA